MNQIVEHRLQRLPFAREYGKARLVEPARSGYLFLAAEVDAHPPFLWASRNKRRLIEDAGHVYTVTASNARRIGAVDHARDGVFLFNYFYADSPAQNLAVWEHTAD